YGGNATHPCGHPAQFFNVISIAQNAELLVRYGNRVRDARTHALIHQHCFRPMDFPRTLVPQYGRGSASHTQASLANHSCSLRQMGQCTREKKPGVASKLLRSVVKPVGMSRPVCGHLTMTAPIGLSPGFCRCATRLAPPVKIV